MTTVKPERTRRDGKQWVMEGSLSFMLIIDLYTVIEDGTVVPKEKPSFGHFVRLEREWDGLTSGRGGVEGREQACW